MAVRKKTSLFFRIVGKGRAAIGFAPELPVDDVALAVSPEGVAALIEGTAGSEAGLRAETAAADEDIA